MRPPDSGGEEPKTTLDELNEQELAVWSHLHGNGHGSRRGRLEPLTAAEQAEFAPFAAVLARAWNAGFRGVHLVVDARHDKVEDASELKVFRDQPDGPTEVIVFCSTKWAYAFRVPRGAPLFGSAELEEEPDRLLDQVLAGAWPEEGRANTEDQQAAVQAWVAQLQHEGYATTGEQLINETLVNDVAEDGAERPVVRWAQSPSDGIWHAVQPTKSPDVEGDDVTAACGHRIPGAAAGHAEEEPKYPTCLPCVQNRGWST